MKKTDTGWIWGVPMLGVKTRPADGWDCGTTQHHISMLACVLRRQVAHVALYSAHKTCFQSFFLICIYYF